MVNKLKTCRCCLSESDELHEFSSEMSMDDTESVNPENFIKIGECFSSLTRIFIHKREENESKICMDCLNELKLSYLFQRKCLDNDKSFNCLDDHDEVVEGQFMIDKSPIKTEDYEEAGAVEYVDEEEEVEYAVVADMQNDNDEDTNDGYEDEHGIVNPETEEDFSLNTMEHGEGPSTSAHSILDRKENYRRHFRRTHLSQAIEESEERIADGGQITQIQQLQLYQCDVCGKISVTEKEHDAHERKHEGEARYKCKKCEKKFSTKEDAREHLTSAHSNDDKAFGCETCSKSFKNRYQLILHTRSHTGEKPFECPVCRRCFSMSSNLQKHLDTHSTEKPYSCTVCNQFFKTQRSLKFHTVCYHQPEAKVQCTQCDKSFVNKSYLKMHMLYHTGQKNFTCTICNSKYYKSSHLKRHIQNVHFKLRLMKCEYCASDFVRKETYKAHIISHHKRHLSEKEFEDVLEKIKKFQPPSMDINQFTLEKQGNKDVHHEVAEVDDMQIIEEESQPEDGMELEAEGDCYELYDEQ